MILRRAERPPVAVGPLRRLDVGRTRGVGRRIGHARRRVAGGIDLDVGAVGDPVCAQGMRTIRALRRHGGIDRQRTGAEQLDAVIFQIGHGRLIGPRRIDVTQAGRQRVGGVAAVAARDRSDRGSDGLSQRIQCASRRIDVDLIQRAVAGVDRMHRGHGIGGLVDTDIGDVDHAGNAAADAARILAGVERVEHEAESGGVGDVDLAEAVEHANPPDRRRGVHDLAVQLHVAAEHAGGVGDILVVRGIIAGAEIVAGGLQHLVEAVRHLRCA